MEHMSVPRPERSLVQSRTRSRSPFSWRLNSGKEMGPLGLTTVFNPNKKAIADLVFVHGLGGGSRKTWSLHEDPALFWPQTWLPKDEGFKDVRIHTFGYDSNWEKDAVLNVHDFAKSLLEWTRDSPAMAQNSDCPILLVCHSLGGLVAKRAYVLAKQIEEYDHFAKRVQAIFFLATPHRGSDFAELLTRILQVTLGSRSYVTDLHPESNIIQSINDEFPHHCQDLVLFSFYETVPMSFGIKKGLVVPKGSAMLGYPNERAVPLIANHRGVCKFDSEHDSNYLVVRNAIHSVLSDFRNDSNSKTWERDHEQQQWLYEVLDIDEAYKDEHQLLVSMRVPDSCEWIAEDASFASWRDSTDSSLYWLTAKPGTGKSILSGYIVSHLQDLGHDCAYYFFRYREKRTSHVGLFLKAMAWQMASMHNEVFEFLLHTCQKDPKIVTMDHRAIWRKIFIEGIFKMSTIGRQYWVIDALDECKNSDLLPWLLKAVETKSIRVCVTCRNTIESYSTAIPKEVRVVDESISPSRTKSDISLFLSSNMENIPALGFSKDDDRASTMRLILEKSAGCFLWARLVLHELTRVHTAAEIREVLEDIPSDMAELYSHIVGSMSNMPRGKTLAKAILKWTTCAVRPLSVDELQDALQIDINDSIDSIRRSIASTCGHLVSIDASFKVHMVHQSARDFLLGDAVQSEFAVHRREGHKALAMVCLQYLSSSEMIAPKRRKLSASAITKDRSPFATYACNSLWEHLAFISSEDDDVLDSLARFLGSSNVLSWIEYIAENSNLHLLVLAGRSLKHFLQRRSRHSVPFGKSVNLVGSWAADLVRLATKFGGQLLSTPSSIFRIIPHFCPSETAIRKQFSRSSRSINVCGLSATDWDDCSSRIVLQDGTPTALACSESSFIIGVSDGTIRVHDDKTCQHLRTIRHGESVKLLSFTKEGDTLASAGRTTICIWSTKTWQRLQTFRIESPYNSITFVDDGQLLLGTSQNSRVYTWNIDTGIQNELANWEENLNEDSVGQLIQPVAMAFDESSGQLAISYRGHDVFIWNIEQACVYDVFCQRVGSLGPRIQRRLGAATAWSLEYSMAVHTHLLAASYNDGMLLIFDTAEGTILARAPANARALASSPDGQILACGTSGGTIQIFEFDTLKLLHRIQSEDFGIKSLVFSPDSHRLIDIRGPNCRVWDPPVLIRQYDEENMSDTVSISTVAQEYKVTDAKSDIYITVVAKAESLEAMFCGKVDGSVWAYSARTGLADCVLFRHTSEVSIVSLVFDNQSSILTSADSSSRVMVHQVCHTAGAWSCAGPFFDHRSGTTVEQILHNPDCAQLLISSIEADTVWSITPHSVRTPVTLPWTRRWHYQWMIHPTVPEHLLLIMDNTAHVFDWDLKRLTTESGVAMHGLLLPDLAIRFTMPCFENTIVATVYAQTMASRSNSKLLFWKTADLSAGSGCAIPIAEYQPFADEVDYIIGVCRRRLVFLGRDGWVCSADAQNLYPDRFDRHFFFPADWLGVAGGLMLEIFRNSTIAFVQGDELAIIRYGLDLIEQRHSTGPGSRPPIVRT